MDMLTRRDAIGRVLRVGSGRLYSEFAGTLTPDVDVAGIRRATDEYNTARNAR